MAAHKNASQIEVGSVILVAVVALVGGTYAMESDPSVTPLVFGAAVVLLAALFAFFISHPN